MVRHDCANIQKKWTNIACMSLNGRVKIRITSHICQSMRSKVDKRLLIILGIVTLLFGSLATYVAFHQSDGWKVAAMIGGVLAAFWIGALSVTFEVDDSDVRYRSAFRRLSLPLASISEMQFVSEFRTNSPQGVPRFYLKTHEGKREPLNVRILPIGVVREFCSLLKSRGVTVMVADDSVAKRMANQIFEP